MTIWIGAAMVFISAFSIALQLILGELRMIRGLLLDLREQGKS